MPKSSLGVLQALEGLARHGWVPLRGMARLLGYNELRGIYQRQKGRNAIPTIKVGGQYRVYEDVVIHALMASEHADADMVLSMYRTIKKRDKEREDA